MQSYVFVHDSLAVHVILTLKLNGEVYQDFAVKNKYSYMCIRFQ